MASNLFEMELEGLSQEDREFEAAKQFVRFASEAVKNADHCAGRQSGCDRACRRRGSGAATCTGAAERLVNVLDAIDVVAIWRDRPSPQRPLAPYRPEQDPGRKLLAAPPRQHCGTHARRSTEEHHA